MRTTKIILFLFTFFLALIANAQRGNMDPEEMAKRNTDAMKERLELNDDQLKKVEAINLETSKKMSEVFASASGSREAMREEMMAIDEEKDEALKPILTEDQWKEYEKMKEEQAEQRRQRMNQN